MEKKQIIDELSDLLKIDVDAVKAYDSAMQNVEEKDILDQLALFRRDHERHVADLSTAILTLGGTPPPPRPDVKGSFIKGFTSVRSMTGTKGALEAMHTNEKLTNKAYADAKMKDFPLDLENLIDKNFNDEQRHLAYIEATINLAPVS